MKTYTRDEMIDVLVNDDINNWYDRDDQADYLSYLLRVGFKGYDQHSDDELHCEMVDRGFIELEEEGFTSS